MLLLCRSALGRVFAAVTASRAAEEPIEDQAGIDLLGDGRGFAAPRKVRLISTTVTVVALAGVLAPLAADLERREPGRMADPLGGRLVDRDACRGGRRRRSSSGDGRSESWPWRGRDRHRRRRGPAQGSRSARSATRRSSLTAWSGSRIAGSSNAAPSDRGVQPGMWTPLGT